MKKKSKIKYLIFFPLKKEKKLKKNKEMLNLKEKIYYKELIQNE
jgi:hypothetical protein